MTWANRIGPIVATLCLVLANFAEKANSSEGFEWKGFLTAGYGQVISPPRRSDGQQPSTDDGVGPNPSYATLSKAGLIGTVSMNKEWDGTVQFIARGDSSITFGTIVEWAMLTYHPIENLSVRIGKQKINTWLISDHFDIGVLYPWVRPPREVYVLNPFSSMVGASVELAQNNVADGRVSLDLFGGSIPTVLDGGTYSIKTKKDTVIVGSTLTYKSDYLTLHSSYAKANFDAELVKPVDGTPSAGTGWQVIRSYVVVPFLLGQIEFISNGAQLDYRNFLMMSEYASEQSQSNLLRRRAGWYGTAGYYMLDRKLLPHFTYSALVENESTLFIGRQHSYTYGLNYSVTNDVMLKAEYQRVVIDDKVAPNAALGQLPATLSMDPYGDIEVVSASVSAIF